MYRHVSTHVEMRGRRRVVAPGQCGAGITYEDLVTEQVLALQAIGADGLGPCQPFLVELQVLLAEGQRQRVGQLVVVAGIALQGGLQRIELHQRIPVLGVQRVEAVGLVGRGAGSAPLGFGRWRRQAQQAGTQGEQHSAGQGHDHRQHQAVASTAECLIATLNDSLTAAPGCATGKGFSCRCVRRRG